MTNKQISETQKIAFRQIPSVEKLINSENFAELMRQFDRQLIIETLREIIDEIRQNIHNSPDFQPPKNYAGLVRMRLDQLLKSNLTPIVNATGTITHTNLGRSLLSEIAKENLICVAENYVDLEFDLESGSRGHRDRITEPLLQKLTGCEASTIVNNNAAAVHIVLNTFARGKEVIVSRGELIEIGGAFRIPDVMAESGAILREIGTTNRTRPRDYENAINENTALLLKVHPSNYQIVGFTETPEISEIVEIGRRHGIPIVEDLGSGSLIDLTEYDLPSEPIVRDRISAGVELVTFSGDKLLGGPQAGVIVGKRSMIEQIRKNPMMRAFRVGKLTIAAIEATLRLYINPLDLREKLPMLKRYTRPISELEKIAEILSERLKKICGSKISISISESFAQIGSGSLPISNLPSLAIVLKGDQISAEMLAQHFRSVKIPIIGRIKEDQLWLDLRAIFDQEIELIIEASKTIF